MENKPIYSTNSPHKNVIGLHLQEPTPDWPKAVGDLGFGSPAGFFQVENITEAKERNAGIFAFHRYFVSHQSAYIDATAPHLSPDDGWLHPDVYNGNFNAYLECLQYWAQKTAEWNALNNNRAIGAVLFNTNAFSGWQWFRTVQPQLGQIFRHFAQWQPDIPPPPVDDYEIIKRAALENNCINLCSQCALEKAIKADGLPILSNEYGYQLSDGTVWVAQNAGTHTDANKIFAYAFPVGNYDPSALVINEVIKP